MTAAGVFEALELLNDIHLRRGAFISKVEERIEHRPGLLARNTCVSLRVPHVLDKPTGFSSDLPFVYVLRAPRRGQIWSLDNIAVSPSRTHRILGHEEHILYSQILIAARYWSLCADWVLGSVRSRRSIAVSTCDRLMAIPQEDPAEALAILNAHFEDGLLRLFGSDPRRSPYERRLYRLCSTLASRYFVCLEFQCEAGESLGITYSFEDQLPDIDHNYQTRDSRRGRIHLAFGGAPTPIFFHAPMARVTPFYDVRLSTFLSTYIHSQVFLERQSSDGHTTGYRTIPEPLETGVRTWRRPTGTSTAHLLLANGTRAERPVYVGMKVFERLPGSAGRSTLIAVSSLIICSFLALTRWVAGEDLTGDAAAVLVAGLAVISFGADALMRWDPTGFVAVRSRVSLLLSAGLLFLFSVWLLLPDGTGMARESLIGWLGRWTVRLGWLVLLVAMLANAVWMWSRFRESVNQYIASAQP